MLQFLRHWIGRSTKKSAVYGMRGRSSSLEKKVDINRAKRSQRIKHFLASASDEEKIDFVNDMQKIESMLLHYVSVSERLLIFLDNNVIEDILKQDTNRKRMQRFHSFLAVLSLAQDYYLIDIFACVTPAILFEAGGKSCKHSLVEAENIIYRVEEAIADTGLSMHRVGFDTPRQILTIFKQISWDEKTIRRGLDKVIGRHWKRQFSMGERGTRVPLSLAEDECPNFRLRYFHPGVVKLLFMHLIEKRMYKENVDQPNARRLMTKQTNAFSILKKKKSGIEGLGDIELLTYCDLTSQTMQKMVQITMGVTYDDNLYDTLWERSSIIHNGPVFESGGDNADDFALSFVALMQQSEKRTSKINQRMNEYAVAKRKFHNEVIK